MKYPVPKPTAPVNTTAPSSLANRGMAFEALLNTTNDAYRQQGLAVIHKKPTPIHVIHIANKGSESYIDKAFFEQPSTTDYNGVYRGHYIDFEAKETRNKTSFPLGNIHHHQIEHLRSITLHGGIGFILINFSQLTTVYLIPAHALCEFVDAHPRSSLPLEWIKEKGTVVPLGYTIPVPYLLIVDQLFFK